MMDEGPRGSPAANLSPLADRRGETDLLIPEDQYLTSGVHIGTQQKSASMRKFIYKVRYDGLYVLDIKETDRRIRLAAKFLSRFPPKKVLAVSQRQYGQKPVKIFAKNVGALTFAERFVPGSLTNPTVQDFTEPEVLVVADPATDMQALSEALTVGIPVVGLCDVNNDTRFVDLVIPTNNKGRASLATIYWLLTREYLRETGKTTPENPFTQTVDDFQAAL